jgi:DNA (cytosine-5)-methyltransferase 1
MRYGSICSGVEAATLAWGGEAPTGESHSFANAGNGGNNPLNWEPVFFAEVEPFPCAVLMQKFGATKPLRPLDPGGEATLNMPLLGPQTEKERKQRENWKKQIDKFPAGGSIPNLGDFTKIEKDDYDGEIDLLAGGPPCTAFSVAGLRKGLDDPRGNLALEFARLAHRIRPRWLVFENVPGILSQSYGEAFAEILSAFCGWKVEVPVLRRKKNGQLVRGWKNSGIVTPAPGKYGLAWRTIDAQYVRVDGHPRAVPQRRRRLFLVGHLDSWERAAAVLFDEESLRGNSPPERKKKQGTAVGFEVGASGGRQSEVSSTLDTKCKDGAIRNQTGMLCMAQSVRRTAEISLPPPVADTPCGSGKQQVNMCMAHGQGNAEVMMDHAPTLNCNHEAPIICNESGKGYWKKDEASGPVKTNGAEATTVVCLNNRPQEFKIEEDLNHSLRASDYKQPPIVCYENHPGDSRIKELKDGVCSQINARSGTGGGNLPLVKLAGFLPSQGTKAGGLGYEPDIAPTLRSGCENYGVVKSYGIAENIINRKEKNGGNGIGVQEDIEYTLNTSAPHGVCFRSTVRRLMPIEAERLMGFPDNHTRIEWNGKPEADCPDGPRYKACGNSMCVNVMRWLGMRIHWVEKNFQLEGSECSRSFNL